MSNLCKFFKELASVTQGLNAANACPYQYEWVRLTSTAAKELRYLSTEIKTLQKAFHA